MQVRFLSSLGAGSDAPKLSLGPYPVALVQVRAILEGLYFGGHHARPMTSAGWILDEGRHYAEGLPSPDFGAHTSKAGFAGL